MDVQDKKIREEFFILILIYLERIRKSSARQARQKTSDWKILLLSCLSLALKARSIVNTDWSTFDLPQIARVEKGLLVELGFNLAVSPAVYCE